MYKAKYVTKNLKKPHITIYMLLEELVAIGYTREEAERLSNDDYFHHKNKTRIELTDIINKIAKFYNCSFDSIREIILKYPSFTRYDHERVIRDAIKIYGAKNEGRIKSAILGYSQFAGLDHERVIRDAIKIYGAKNEGRIKSAILKHPPFAGLDHERVIRDAIKIYGAKNEGRIKSTILGYPPFAGLDHERVIRDAIKIYGAKNEGRIKSAILGYPPFAGLDHERVIRQKTRFGRMIGLSDEETINYLLNLPDLAGYGVKRYLAAFDIVRQLEKEGFKKDKNMFRVYLQCRKNSHYVPGFKKEKKRISQVVNYKEPALLKRMRKSLMKFRIIEDSI